MTAGWLYFWPLFAAGLLVGVITGVMAFRAAGSRRRRAFAIGAAATIAFALLWHGPLGGANRFAAAVEHEARFVLNDWEMGAVSAHLQRAPLTRRLELAGPADQFQRGELVRLMGLVHGVGGATWSKSRALPLAGEGVTLAVLAMLIGLVLAYVGELRRRHNAQWSW